MLVHAAFAVVQQSVLTLLQADSAVRAFKEVVTEVRVRVRLDAMLLWAGWKVQQHAGFGCKQQQQCVRYSDQLLLLQTTATMCKI